MSIIKNFYVNPIKSDLYVINFYLAAIFELFKVSTKHAELERIYPMFSYFSDFPTIDPSFIIINDQ